jgi:succinate-acetate transporter protein
MREHQHDKDGKPALCAGALFWLWTAIPLLLNSRGETKMNTDRIKWMLLGVFLILYGLVLVGLKLAGLPIEVIAGLCAIIAGVLFLINR